MPDWNRRVDPELAPLLRRMPFWTWGPVTRTLARVLGGLVPDTAPDGITHRIVHTGANELYLYEPEHGRASRGAVLYLHGGGLIIGHPRQYQTTMVRLASTHGVLVAGAKYRLAPRHRCPAALDDGHAAYRWLVDNAAALGIDPARIVVMGDSAGGGLAAALVQRGVDEGTPPAAQALIYPMLDDRTVLDDAKTAANHPVWNNTSNRYGWTCYLGEPGGDVPPYAAAARRPDLTGLPPAWLAVGELDLFHDEVVTYARRLEEAGVPVELLDLPGAFHGYFVGSPELGPVRRTWESLDAFLRVHLAHPSSSESA